MPASDRAPGTIGYVPTGVEATFQYETLLKPTTADLNDFGSHGWEAIHWERDGTVVFKRKLLTMGQGVSRWPR